MRQTLTEIYDARVTAGELHADPAQRATLPLLEAVRAALEVPLPRRAKGLRGLLARAPAPAPPKGVYLWGGVGRGKSMLMDLFFAHVATPAKRRVHFHGFMQEVQGQLHALRKTDVQDAVHPVAEAIASRVRLLCFDEMQIGDIADAMIVGRLFQYLLDLGVVVVTTSNRVPEGLYLNGLNRALFLPFIALMRARLTVWELESETDYRQHRLAGAKVYFTPVNAESTRAMQAMWDDLTGADPGVPLRLPLLGRELVLQRHHAGVARASFWELCARPLGPADYLALAAAVRVLMIDEIPLLSASNFNEAKRFVTLIDAAYEARLRLICSAADLPERLYVEGEGTFEFARTASRLREMQAADWEVRG
ncbi:cell division protein ZapE [Phaeovulum sp.]|uniref:cell division protein ZapE n=1 Tax=Phaeovulum sp. TaxID=2934796 RepID=UPI0027316C75|nr:cell division protein ZapE [Phaeovulum sp.]MDP1669228.1 cell division protein ZapE [Phaeovulum sp.]MDZ4119527.1 cell division protein ZapE [Phaeovulum sp.]